MSELWTSLVYVASKQTGTQRLKTIQLLLKILQTQHRYTLFQYFGIYFLEVLAIFMIDGGSGRMGAGYGSFINFISFMFV